MQQPFSLRLQEGSSSPTQGYNGYAHSFAGMGVQFILMLGVEIGVALLLMRRMDLWKRLRVAPVSRATLLGSRMASTALIAFVLFAAIMLAGILFFGVRVLGSWAGFLVVMATLLMVLLGFALLFALIAWWRFRWEE